MSDENCPIDFEKGLSLAGNERDLFIEFLWLMIEHIAATLPAVREAATKPDIPTLLRIALPIKQYAKNNAAHRLYDLTSQLITYAETESPSPNRLLDLIHEVDKEYERILEFVSRTV